MRHVNLSLATIAGLALAGSAAAFFAPGADNGWDISGANSAMTDQGGGIWTYDASGLGAGARTDWNIVATANDWGSQLYGSNQFGYADGNGDVTLILDTNTYNDGWLPSTNRITTSTAGTLNWVITGSWVAAAGVGNDWDLGSAPAMTPVGGGIFEYATTLPAGTYAWKPVGGTGPNGEWDAITDDSSTTIGQDNNDFTVANNGDLVVFQIDTSNGTVRIIPTPGVAGLLGVAGIAAVSRRRR